MGRFSIALFGVAIALAAGQQSALADGCFFPETTVAKLPEIPTQRALLAFRNGQETLIIESSLKGEGRRFGWVIPVPAKPDAVEAVSSGAVTSLALGVQPRLIKGFLGAVAFALFVSILAVLALAVWALLRQRGASWLASIGCALAGPIVAIPILGIAFMLFFGIGMGAAGVPEALTARPGVAVLERQRVGAYDVAVLAADDAEALSRWLAAEKLALPEQLKPLAQDYISRNWRFVTAKLATDGGGAATPHPLSISFATAQAVYPMRLTGLAGAAVALELYVVANQAACAPGMKRVFCEQFSASREASYASAMRAFRLFHGEQRGQLSGVESGLVLGHPDLLRVLWSGCWLSKLTGSLPPEAMSSDLALAWEPPRAERQTFFTWQATVNIGLMAVDVLLTLGILVALLGWGLGRFSGMRMLRVVAWSALAAAAAFIAVYLALPTTPTSSVGGKGRPSDDKMAAMMRWLDNAPWEVDERKQTPATFAASLRAESRSWINLYTGEPIREEDSSGNFTLKVEDRQVLFTFYDQGGTPIDVAIKWEPKAP